MGESSFWGALFAVCGVVCGVSTPFVILWFRHRALRSRVPAHRTITEAERETLRRRGRLSVLGFAGFWVISLGLLLAVSRLAVSPRIEAVVLAVILAMVAGCVWQQLNTRCPVCHYRLGYQRSLGVPARCERCGVSF